MSGLMETFDEANENGLDRLMYVEDTPRLALLPRSANLLQQRDPPDIALRPRSTDVALPGYTVVKEVSSRTVDKIAC